MQVIDILNKCAFKEHSNFKFYVKSADLVTTARDAINWEYKDGYVRNLDGEDGFFYFLDHGSYLLDHEIVIIEDEEIKPLPPLEYIKFNIEQSVDNISNTITYMLTTVTTDLDTELLALIINRLIREVEDLKHRLEVTDKELEDHKKDLFSHNSSSVTIKAIDANKISSSYIYDTKGVMIGKNPEVFKI